METMPPNDFENMMDLSMAEAVARYGEPTMSEQFIVDGALSEFRIGLYNIYPPAAYRSKKITLAELTWEKDGQQNITVWYEADSEGQWRPKHSLEWAKGSEF